MMLDIWHLLPETGFQVDVWPQQAAIDYRNSVSSLWMCFFQHYDFNRMHHRESAEPDDYSEYHSRRYDHSPARHDHHEQKPISNDSRKSGRRVTVMDERLGGNEQGDSQSSGTAGYAAVEKAKEMAASE